MLRNPGLRKSVEQPVLDLNFAASQIGSNGAPDGRMNDFNRGSNAWFVDSDGLVKKSPHNLITQSEAINSSPWFVTAGVTITANNITAPDGTLTADKLEKDASGFRAVISGFTGAGVSDYAASFFVKEGTLDDVTVLLTSDSAATLNARVAFDLTSETTTDYGSANLKSASITDVGGGWYRCTVEATFANQTSPRVYIYPGVHSASTAGFVYIWGVQVSQHTTLPVDNPYLKTEGSVVYAAKLDHDPSWFMSAAQEQNLLRYSEMLDDSAWYKIGVTVTADATTDPLGGTTAERVEEDTTTGTHVVYASLGNVLQVTSGTTYTFSAYVKADELDKIRLQFSTTHFPTQTADFDLSAESVATTGSVSASITDSGNGWYRCAITATANGTGQNNANLWLSNAAGQQIYTGANNGLFIWGVQIEVGSTASTYHRTEGAPYYGPGATPKGLLIEEARTNLVTESEDFGTTWTTSTVTVDTDEVLAPDGATSADFLEETTATSVHEISMASLVTDATSKHVLSCFVKAQDRTIFRIAGAGYSAWATGGTWPNAFFDLSTETVTLSSGHSAGMEDYGNGWYRCHVVGTSGSSPSGAGMTINVIKTGTTTSYTGEAGKGLYVWGAQLEKGDFLTSYMQTTGTSLTRNADVATMGPTVAPDKLGTELIVDGDFPSLDNFSQTAAGNFSVSGGILEVEPTANFSRVYQSVPTEVGKRYRASVFGRTESSSDGYALYAGTAALGGDATAYGKANSQTTDFLEITLDFTATTTTAFIGVGDQGSPDTTDSHFFHTLSLKEILPGIELVTNGTFDTDTTGWFANNVALSVSSGQLTADDSADAGNWSAAVQELDVVTGRRYRVSFDIVSLTATVSIGFRDTQSYSDAANNLDNYNTFTTTGTKTVDLTADATKPYFVIGVSGTSNAVIDNVSVRELYPFEQYNPAEGTVLFEANVPAGMRSYGAFFNIADDGVYTDRISIINNDTNSQVYTQVRSGGTILLNTFGNSVSYTLGQNFRVALAYAASDFASTVDATTVQKATSGAVPPMDSIKIGIDAGNATPGSFHARRVRIFPKRLPDSILQSLTSD